MKKALSVILSCLLLVSVIAGLAACTQEEPGEKPTRPEGYYPNITLSLSNLTYVQYIPLLEAKGWTLINNPIMDLYKKELGIKFKLDIDVQDIGVYFDKLAARLATGEMSDISCLGDYYFGIPNLKTAEQNGLLCDLTPYMDGTDEVQISDLAHEIWDQAGADVFYPGTFNGRIKALPWVTDSRGGAYSFLYFRKDWLDEVNMSLPTTVDELTEVMRAFKNSGEGRYGMVLCANGMYAGENHCSVFDMYGAYPFEWLEGEDGKLYFGATDTNAMKGALKTLQNWYAEGLINCDEDNDIDVIGGLHYMSTEFVNGKAGVFCGSTSMGFVGNTIKKNANAEIVTTPLFAADGGTVGIAATNNAFIFYAVSNKCKYPEAAIKLWNMYTEIHQDEDYIEYFSASTYENDKGEIVEDYAPEQFSPFRCGAKTDIEKSKAFLEDILAKNTTDFTAAEMKTYEKYWEAVENTNYKNYWTLQQYKEGGVLSQYYDLLENAEFVRSKFFGTNTPAMDKYVTEIEPNLVIAAIEIIKGHETVDYWDTAVDAWLDMGGREITDEVNAWWDGINGR